MTTLSMLDVVQGIARTDRYFRDKNLRDWVLSTLPGAVYTGAFEVAAFAELTLVFSLGDGFVAPYLTVGSTPAMACCVLTRCARCDAFAVWPTLGELTCAAELAVALLSHRGGYDGRTPSCTWCRADKPDVRPASRVPAWHEVVGLGN